MKNENLFRSWKEIAVYLGCDRRTGLRWEKKIGLPIHRVEDGGKGSVFAYKEELDRWITWRSKANGKNGYSEPNRGPATEGVDPPLLSAAEPRNTKSRHKWPMYNPLVFIPVHLAIFALMIVVVLFLTRKPEIAFYATHKPDFPSQFVILDTDHRLPGEYWNPGHFNEIV